MDQTKRALIETIALKMNLPVIRAQALVDRIFDAMSEALLRGEGIELRGFGSFTLGEYGAYRGRDPRSGDPVDVSKNRLPYFRVGKELRDRITNAQQSARGARSHGGGEDDVGENGDRVELLVQTLNNMSEEIEPGSARGDPIERDSESQFRVSTINRPGCERSGEAKLRRLH